MCMSRERSSKASAAAKSHDDRDVAEQVVEQDQCEQKPRGGDDAADMDEQPEVEMAEQNAQHQMPKTKQTLPRGGRRRGHKEDVHAPNNTHKQAQSRSSVDGATHSWGVALVDTRSRSLACA